MSFGFGPGDIVALITFSKKVYDALESGEGSQAEYRQAVKQCDAFATVINQVKRVDLSRFPTDFRQELEEIYTNAAEHITLFRKNTIDKYEKSLGKGTKRGLFASAPRKVQWAFDAAEELEGLRQSLNSWLSAIQMCITTNMFERSLRNEGPFPAYYALPGPPVRSLTLPQLRQEPPQQRHPLYLDRAPPAASHLEMERTVSLVSNLVYKRLLSRPGLPIAEAPKVFTLGPGDAAEAVFLQGTNANGQINPDIPPRQHPSTNGQRTRSHSPSNEHDATTGAAAPNIVNDTNSYLQDMHLPPLTTSEAATLSGRDHDPQIPTPGSAPPDPSQEDRSRSPKTADSSHQPQVDPDTPSHPSSRARGIALALSSLIGMSAKTSYKLRVSDRQASRHSHQVTELFRKLAEYMSLLHCVAATLSHSSSSGNAFLQPDVRGLRSPLEASVEAVRSIIYALDNFISGGGFFGSIVLGSRLSWMVRRRGIMDMVHELEGLKVNLLIMLQVAQMENDREMFHRVEASRAHSLALLESTEFGLEMTRRADV